MSIEQRAVEQWGVEQQIVVAIEECAELIYELTDGLFVKFSKDVKALEKIKESGTEIKSVCKFFRLDKPEMSFKTTVNTKSEMADVQIILNRLKFIVGNIDTEMAAKLKRVEEKLKDATV